MIFDNRQFIKQNTTPEIDYSKLKVQDNYYSDDVWKLDGSPRDINFEFYNDRPEMKEQIKRFVLSLTMRNGGSTVLRKVDGIKAFYKYIVEYHPYVKRFEDTNKMVINSYFRHMLEVKSRKTKKELSSTAIWANTAFLKDLFYEGHRKSWLEVNGEMLLTVVMLHDNVIASNPRVQKGRKATTKNEYSLKTIKTIITSAYQDEDLYLKTMIFLGSQCGLRIDEILSIKENAITEFDIGEYKLAYITTKTKKGKVVVTKPINALAADILNELSIFTRPIRKRLKTPFVFVSMMNAYPKAGIARNHKYMKVTLKGKELKYDDFIMNKDNINKYFFKPFVKRWDIRESGKLIDLSSHYNRHFFAHLSWLENLSVQSIKYMLNHESFAMTNTYMYNAEKLMRDKFKQMMSDPDNMTGPDVGDIKEKLKKKNVFVGKVEGQLEAIINAMNIEVLSNGACMHHPLKAKQRLEKCKPGCLRCDRFTTHKVYVDVHKRRVNRIEKIMEDSLDKGKKDWYEKNKIERDYIVTNFIEPFKGGA